jgi:hypothetical protein
LFSAMSKTAADDDAFVFPHASASARAEKLCKKMRTRKKQNDRE